jgi:uridylate kinase
LALVYRRILLKLSGEALEGAQGHGIEASTLGRVADEVGECRAAGAEIAIVVGGGNFFRGVAGAASGMERATADTIGMLATVMNGLALRDALERRGCKASVLSAFAAGPEALPFSRRLSLERLGAGEVVILTAGTGSPYFTTDTAAALRALEIGADALLKATRVDGIYDRDPLAGADAGAAVRFDELTYDEVLSRRLRVMDLTAVTLCRENALPLVVFALAPPGNLRRVLLGEAVGSRVREAAR